MVKKNSTQPVEVNTEATTVEELNAIAETVAGMEPEETSLPEGEEVFELVPVNDNVKTRWEGDYNQPQVAKIPGVKGLVTFASPDSFPDHVKRFFLRYGCRQLLADRTSAKKGDEKVTGMRDAEKRFLAGIIERKKGEAKEKGPALLTVPEGVAMTPEEVTTLAMINKNIVAAWEKETGKVYAG